MDMNVFKKDIEDYRIQIFADDMDESPRDWDNLGTMVCWNRQYGLGDKHDFASPDAFREWRDEQKGDDAIAVVLPLFLYDHSGIGMSTSNSQYPYNCPWDSGQVGWIYVTRGQLKKEYSVKAITKSVRERAQKVLISEVDTYHQYISGNVLGFSVAKIGKCEHCTQETKEHVDSLWGIYGGSKEVLEHIKPILPPAVFDELERSI